MPTLQLTFQNVEFMVEPFASIEIFFGPPLGCPIEKANVELDVVRVQPA
jgi:hypothetical protein